MKHTGFMILALLVSACGHSGIDPVFQPYVDSFSEVGKINITAPMTIKFGDLIANETHTGGKCVRNSLGGNTITIDQKSWDGYTDIQREMMMYHELGHCVLGREHSMEKDFSGNAQSLMAPSPFAVMGAYATDKTPYLQELFSNPK